MVKVKSWISAFLVLMLAVGMVPAALADGTPLRISGELEDGKYVFTIPEGAGSNVVLDFKDYLDGVVTSYVDEQGYNWDPGSWYSRPVIIRNASGKTYNYSDAHFTFDFEEETEDNRYYIRSRDVDECDRTERDFIPFHSVVRTLSQPLVALYGAFSSERLTTMQVMNAEEEIKKHGPVTETVGEETKTVQIPETVNTYGDYALWYYNTFFNANAETLMDLPQIYKLNLLGYANWLDSPDLEQGNTGIKETFKFKGKGFRHDPQEWIDNMTAATEGRAMGTSQRINEQSTFGYAYFYATILETDPDIIDLAMHVLYQYGLRFTFDYRTDYDAVFFFPVESGNDEESKRKEREQWQQWLADEGNMSWTSLCASELSAEDLAAENLTYTQNSVKNTLGLLSLPSLYEVEYDVPVLTLAGYAVPNAFHFTGAMDGLGLTVELQTPPEIPETGDHSHLALWSIMVVDCGAAIVLMQKRKQHA